MQIANAEISQQTISKNATFSNELHASCNHVGIRDQRIKTLVTTSGDHIHVETHVPIPNTTVKHMEPMIVPQGAKVGHCRFF